MKKQLLLGLFLSGALIPSTSSALSITLGEQDFTDGQVLTYSSMFNSASSGEAAPFNTFIGSDPRGPNFNASFSYSFTPGSFTSATLTFGLYDGDGDEVGTQLASFSLDGVDLSTYMLPLIESTKHATVNIISFTLPNSALAKLTDGVATFILALKGPSKIQCAYNGAGLDFATLNAVEGNQRVPDFGSTAPLLAMGIGMIAFLRRKLA